VYASMMAERLGFKALYLSGGGVANASFGLPDLGMTTLNDVLEEVLRVTYATQLPLLFGKCRANLGYRLSAARSEEIMALCLDLRRLEKMSVHEFMGMLVV
ncbi:MAG TPA: hypothetical protein VHN12_07055, partial [Geobacteraceae bacterium]|nr:hypothetical protein [Geobacteraceae bacterium]